MLYLEGGGPAETAKIKVGQTILEKLPKLPGSSIPSSLSSVQLEPKSLAIVASTVAIVKLFYEKAHNIFSRVANLSTEVIHLAVISIVTVIGTRNLRCSVM